MEFPPSISHHDLSANNQLRDHSAGLIVMLVRNVIVHNDFDRLKLQLTRISSRISKTIPQTICVAQHPMACFIYISAACFFIHFLD